MIIVKTATVALSSSPTTEITTETEGCCIYSTIRENSINIRGPNCLNTLPAVTRNIVGLELLLRNYLLHPVHFREGMIHLEPALPDATCAMETFHI